MIYLDYHATTPCDPRVVQAMIPFFFEDFGNPSSSIHRIGRAAEKAVLKARENVASLISAEPKEVIFTSGSTESNNLALFGLANGNTTARRRIVTTCIEHKAILEPCKELQKRGYEIVFLPLSREGVVDLDQARSLINEQTLLVSVQLASNEIGTIQPLAEIAEIAHEKGAFVHTDAAQAVGKIPVDVQQLDVDLLSISSHKLYGPKGVGALFIRGSSYALPIKPLFLGGGQENGLRPGTLNVPGIVGFGEACRLCQIELPEEAKRLRSMRDLFESQLKKAIPTARLNGALNQRLPNNSNITFCGIEAEALIANMPQLAISTGSACTSGALEPSHVLIGIGMSREEAYQTIRIGVGRFTTKDDIEQALAIMINTIREMREE